MIADQQVAHYGPALIDTLMRPESYPERPASVELCQTHISCAFLAGDYVYKIKKPVRFSFVDASTLARRRYLCEEEVRLNRRLAPDVYLGVVPIARRHGRLMIAETGNGAGAVEEYAVKMRRLEDAAMLDRMIAGGEVREADITAIARRIAEFHRSVPAEKGWTYGSAAAIWRLVGGNLEEVRQDCAAISGEAELDELDAFIRSFVETRWRMLNERALYGRVREGHGDLRCEHVSLAGGSVRVIDCVEFNEALRYVDVASDLAFLAMDLDRLGALELSDVLVSAYREASGDAGLALALPLYRTHRALVRAKVGCLTHRDPAAAPERRAAAASAGRDYLALALGYARESAPAMVVVCGISGSGKSTVARRLADRIGFEVLSSDVMRKGLAGVAPTERLPADYKAGFYSREFTERTYSALLGAASERVEDGVGVIVDATFGESALRATAREIASRARVPILFVECTASEREIVRRLEQRARRADEVSDAGVAVYLRQRHNFTALSEIPDRNRLTIDTSRDLVTAITSIRQRLQNFRRTMPDDVVALQRHLGAQSESRA